MADKFQALRDQVANAAFSEEGGIYSFDPNAWGRECTPPVIRSLLAELDRLGAAQAPAQPADVVIPASHRAVMQQALDALEAITRHFGLVRLGESRLADSNVRCDAHAAMTALRAALSATMEKP